MVAVADSDAHLVHRATAGDAAAFEELVRRYEARLFRTLAAVLKDPAEAEDATQDAFVKAWNALDRYRGDAEFFTWLYRIGLNEAFQRLRRKRLPTVPLGPIDQLDTGFGTDVADWSSEPGRTTEANELADVADRAIAELPAEYRIAILLRDVEGLSNEDAAEVVGLSVPAFKSRLHRARMAVRQAIDMYLMPEAA
jgi:RNA polymerase sigma-70 factor (ECF subfamily)